MIRLKSTWASGARAIAVPWWPLLAFSGASIAKPRMRSIACCSCSGVNVAGTFSTVPAGGGGRDRLRGSDGGQQREREEVPRAVIDAAVGEDLPVLRELELALHQPVGELARVDVERADVARHLLVIFAAT